MTQRTPSDVNFRAGRGGPEYDRFGEPNSYVNFGNGHAAVYGPDGRVLYDVSASRIKIVKWNKNPNTGQWFPRTSSDTKTFQNNVPQSVLDDLGLS